MNPIDEIARATEEHINRRPKFLRKLYDVQDETWEEIRKYEKTVSADQFALELLRSNQWGGASVSTACRALRAVVLRLAEKL